MRPWLVAALLLPGLAWARKPQPPNEVTLTFGWQPGWKGTTTTRFEDWEGPRGVDGRLGVATSKLAVEAGADGELIVADLGGTFDETQVRGGAEVPKSEDPLQRALASALAQTPEVRFRVSPDADLLGLHEPDAYFAWLRNWTDKVLATFMSDPRVAALPAEASARFGRACATFLANASNPDIRVAEENETWAPQTGFWPGAKLEIGTVYENTGDYVDPSGGAAVPAAQRWAAEAYEPCHAGKKAPLCVRLRLDVHYTAPVDLAAQLGKLGHTADEVERMTAEVTDARETVTRSHVVRVEPATLRPHHATHTITTVETTTKTDGTVDTRERLKITERTYTWAR